MYGKYTICYNICVINYSLFIRWGNSRILDNGAVSQMTSEAAAIGGADVENKAGYKTTTSTGSATNTGSNGDRGGSGDRLGLGTWELFAAIALNATPFKLAALGAVSSPTPASTLQWRRHTWRTNRALPLPLTPVSLHHKAWHLCRAYHASAVTGKNINRRKKEKGKGK